MLLAILTLAPANAAFSEPIRVRTSTVLLNNREPDERRVGRLTFLGGLSLHSSDSRFGGLSGVHVSPDGRHMIAISDIGYWFQAELLSREDGSLKGLRNARLSPMLGTDGKPLSGKLNGDAEGLAVTEKGIYVSFERRHRIWRYPLTEELATARPVALPAPADLASVKNNKGLEALAPLPDGRLLLLTEESLDREGNIRGWLGLPDGQTFAPLRLIRTPPFAVTAAARLPGKREILILERRFSRTGGLGIRLQIVAMTDIAPNAVLKGREVAEFAPGHTIDNFEGLSARVNREGGTVIYLLSDDNFNVFQRTLLLSFRLEK